MTTYSKYIVLIVLVLLGAITGVLWKEDNAPTITFTRPDTTSDVDQGQYRNQDQRLNQSPNGQPSSVGINPYRQEASEPLADATDVEAPAGQLNEQPIEPTLRIDDEPKVVANVLPYDETRPAEETLSDSQLAKQVRLEKARLADMQALNARKQAKVDELLAEGNGAEMSLLEAELAYQIDGWRQAWIRGDAYQYFAYYSEQFKPASGRSLEQWKAERAERLQPDSEVQLTVENVEVEFDSETQRSLVQFKQTYQSPTYKDVTQKRLIMLKEQGQWKIVSEVAQTQRSQNK